MEIPKEIKRFALRNGCLDRESSSIAKDFSCVWILDRQYYFNHSSKFLCELGLNYISLVWLKTIEIVKFLLFSPKVINSKIIFFKILNGYTYINVTNRRVFKVVKASLEPNFIANYQISKQSIPENIPVIKFGKFGHYYFVVSELLTGAKKSSWPKWPKKLTDITDLMGKVYFTNTIEDLPSNKYIYVLLNKMRKQVKENKYMNKEYIKIIELFDNSAKKYNLHNTKQYRLFSHGDLVPNNLITYKKREYFLDWDNGGYQNFLYDLFMQDFYFINSSTWINFGDINFISQNDKSIFSGWSKQYLSLMRRGLKTDLTNEQVRTSLIICLAEMAEKNYLRYQTREESSDGKKILSLVRSHYINILN